MSNLELKTKNLEEHYLVIRSNVQQASQELTLKLEEKLNVEKELGQLRNQIIFEKGQYEQEVVKTRKLFSLLEQQRQDLDKRKHDLVLDERMHSVAISEAKEVKNNLVNETHKVEIEINELNKQKVKLIDELAEYEGLTKQKIEVLYDDRSDKAAGEKFVDADLLGCPFRLVVSPKTLQTKSVELKRRQEKEAKLVAIDKVGEYLL